MLEGICAEWGDFRRELDDDGRAAFDSIFNKARAHSSAASFGIRTYPMESVYISIMLEQEKEIIALKKMLDGRAEQGGGTMGRKE